MPEYNAAASTRPASRIDQDVERVKAITERVVATREALSRFAHSLGYFSPPDKNGPQTSAPTPMVTNMSDALSTLDRESDHMLGTLNLFQ